MNEYRVPIHVSDAAQHLRCKRAWYLGSPLGLNLEAKVPRTYFTYGRVIHYALNQRYQHGANTVSAMYQWAEAEVRTLALRLGVLPERLAEDYMSLFEECAGVLAHYDVWTAATGADAEIEKWIAGEREFSVPLRRVLGGRASGALRYEGRFDGIVQLRADPRPWVFEVKTARSVKEGQLEYLSHDLQASMYVYACRELYGSCGGVYYTFLRKKAPADLKVLKDGTFSSAVNQDTTPWWFEHRLREEAEVRGEEPDAWVALWKDFLVKLEQAHTPFFRRIRITRPESQVSEALQLMYTTGLAMRKWKGDLPAAVPSWLDCRQNGCSFYIPCLLQLRGQDWSRYLAANYDTRRGWSPELEMEEEA